MREMNLKLYSNDYVNMLREEIHKFRQIGHQFMNREINSAQFKGSSGGMGVYAQKGGEKFMVRLRIPAGVLSLSHLDLICSLAKEYKLKDIHFTTRQDIQLHNLDIDEVCDIMEKCLDHGLYTRGSGGNYPRNVSLSPLSGVEIGEEFDVTPDAIKVCNYFMERITSYHLPRKFKVAFSNNGSDYVGSTVTDMGFLAVKKDGKPFFQLFLAGGLGANPSTGIPYKHLISPEDVLIYVEGAIRLFAKEGDYGNKSKARLRYIPQRMGVENFLNCFETEVNVIKAEWEQNQVDMQDISTAQNCIDTTAVFKGITEEDKNLIPQKKEGLYTVVIHPLCGLMPTEDLSNIAEFLKSCEGADIRLGMSEDMYIRNLTYTKARELLILTKGIRQTLPVQMSVSCIGVPTCQIGIGESQALLKSILEKLEQQNIQTYYLPSIHISGCPNSCARHQVSELGFAGSKKRIGDSVKDVFELFAGGCICENPTFGKSYGYLLKEDIPDFIVKLAIRLDELKLNYSDYITSYSEDFEKLVQEFQA